MARQSKANSRPPEAFGELGDAASDVFGKQLTDQHTNLFERAVVGIFRSSPEGRYLMANPALARIFGYESPHDLVTSVTDIGTQVYVAHGQRAEINQRVATHDAMLDFELECLRRDGTRIWVRLDAQAVRDESGKLEYFEGFIQDITERKCVQVLLGESESRLRTVLEAMPVMLDAFDERGVLVAWNRECERVTGYSAKELVGNVRAMEILYPDRDYRESMLRDWVQRGSDCYEREWDITCKDGSVRSIAWSNVSDRAPVPGWATWGIGSDVTDRKRQEAERRLSEFALSRASVAAYLIAPDARILRVNQANCEMLGYTEDELTHMTVHDVNPAFPVEVWPAHWRDLRANKQMRFESILRHKDGHTFPVEIEINYLEFEGQEYNFAFVRDITERKILEERLRQSQKMEAIGRLAGGVAHDFNNMLTVINGYAELLLADLPETDRRREQLADILGAGQRAAGLTAQLLAFSRKAIIEPRVLDLNQVAESVVRMLRRLIGEDVRIVTEFAPDLAEVKVDPGQFEQLIMNLAVNARDAMPRGGLLTIATAVVDLRDGSHEDSGECPPGRYVQLKMSDTGEGMSEEIKARIFEPFFTTKGVGKGTGLGLSTVYGIVSQAGGAISVDSEVGHGTTFRVLLPAVEMHPEVVNIEPIPQSLRGHETILLAEDEEGVRRLARLALEMRGYTVLEADCGEAAIRVAAACCSPIHLLITDAVMPDFGGRQLADAIKATRPGMAVLYMSGYMDDAVIRHGIEASVDAFLQKPFTSVTLARKVRDVIDAAPQPTE